MVNKDKKSLYVFLIIIVSEQAVGFANNCIRLKFRYERKSYARHKFMLKFGWVFISIQIYLKFEPLKCSAYYRWTFVTESQLLLNLKLITRFFGYSQNLRSVWGEGVGFYLPIIWSFLFLMGIASNELMPESTMPSVHSFSLMLRTSPEHATLSAKLSKYRDTFSPSTFCLELS